EGETSNPAYRSPLYAYDHGEGCAITGGAFYNPSTSQFPAEYVGDYFFADYCSDWIQRYDPATDTVTDFLTGAAGPVDIQVGPDGSLFYLNINNGSVRRVQYSAGTGPSITDHPDAALRAVGQSVTFTVSASGTPPLSYQWQRNNVNIGGATSASYTINSVQMSDNGANFRAIVTNSLGSATSENATLTVTGSTPPTASISTPAAGTLYNAGTTVSYSGNGTDPEDGTLPASAFTWSIVFHHDQHTHPFIANVSGSKTGSFTIPDIGHVETNVWYRIHLSVTDSSGLTHSVSRDIHPRISDLTFTTQPAGLDVTVDGQPRTTPVTLESVVGVRRAIGVVTPQSSGGEDYVFESWSDGGAADHEIVTPATDASYTASFESASSLTTITFDDRAGQNQPLNGSYPSGVVSWGNGAWYHSGPWGAFDTKSASFTSSAQSTGAFTFQTASRLISLDAYNGSGSSTTLTLSCSGQPNKATTIAPATAVTVTTGWTGTCTTVTVATTNGWDTNIDDITFDSGGASSPSNAPPTADAGSDLSITLPATASLDGAVSDDGLPDPPGQLTTTWSKVSGPGTVSFGNASQVDTSASFSAAGSYVLRLSASDGALTTTDDVAVTVQAANGPPTVATPASATPNPVSATTTALRVLGADNGGESALIYTWSMVSGPVAPAFSPNGTNAAKNSTATFTRAGSYSLRVTIRDAGNQTVTSDVSVTVNQTLTSITVAPASASVSSGGTQQFTANARDQFGQPQSPQPAIAWSVSGGGTINSSGLFTAGTSASGPHTVTATSGSVNGTASVSVTGSSGPAGLVAAYGFNETSGSTVGDASGSNNNGTISGATRTASGRYGRALSFDGSNDRVNINDSASLDLTSGMTIEAWVRPTTFSGWETVIMKERPGNLVYALYGHSDLDRPWAEIGRSAGQVKTMGTAALAANTWTHLAATYDGSMLRFYVNGVQVSSIATTGNIMTSTGALRIGGNAVWGNEYFAGLIDEVRIYNRALSAAEVQSDMNTPVGP
ncbi:MAG TPA: LamG-like jellyroll fold domain-containing protein, partial [Dehalococcoidia bacterium]|nr:LamG-like jellyroll fold domain-containing protein [Dehalococcoidia bacterium]